MEEMVSILQYLMPGFVAAWIFYSFTSYPRPAQFERVVQALIFTIFVEVLVIFLKNFLMCIGTFCVISEWNDSSRLICSVVSAIFLGIIFSYFANNDKLHALFRQAGITRETSFSSEWFGGFFRNATFVVLHFKDDRRLYGWPIEWPSEPAKGHFLIEDPAWLVDEIEEDGEKKTSEKRITGVNRILVDSKDSLFKKICG